MFTVKVFSRGRATVNGYEALWYSVVDEEGHPPYVQFETPPPDRGLRQIELSEDYMRVVVENATGKTVENLFVSNDTLAEIRSTGSTSCQDRIDTSTR